MPMTLNGGTAKLAFPSAEKEIIIDN